MRGNLFKHRIFPHISNCNRKRKQKISRRDFRVCILFKYIYIGVADICFWWTVWNIADYLYPMDITKDGAYSYLRGYILIISANLLYLFVRLSFAKIFDRFYEKHARTVYSAVIVTESKIIKYKPLKFKLLKLTFPLCIYCLVVGFIQVWRGLFATFDYIIELLYDKYGMNKILSSVLFEIVVGFTLAFTMKNNAVNLCPSHKLYKYDELDYTDALFNLHMFGNLRSKAIKTSKSKLIVSEVIENHNSQDYFDDAYWPTPVTSRRSSVVTSNFVDHEFDVVQFATSRILTRLQNNRHKSSDSITPLFGNTKNESIATLTKDESTKKVVEKKLGGGEVKEEVRLEATKQEMWNLVFKTYITKQRDLDEKKLRSFEENPSINIHSEIHKNIERYKESPKMNHNSPLFSDKRKKDQVHINYNATEYLDTIDKSEFGKRKGSIRIVVQPAANEDNNNNKDNNNDKDNKEKSKEKNNSDTVGHQNKESLLTKTQSIFIQTIGYIYTIHHRQIFLHVFGGMFWSTTWKIFDFATESVFTKTACDLPGLALIAMLCHCLNHLVLFRFKETASGIHWKTFYEFFCGICTVCLWASVWYIWDIFAAAIGHKLIVYIVMNVASFGALAIQRISINTAL